MEKVCIDFFYFQFFSSFCLVVVNLEKLFLNASRCLFIMLKNILIFVSVSNPPKLETMENLMKLSQMLIQGVWESKSTFLMLPHISQDNLRHFNTKKVF